MRELVMSEPRPESLLEPAELAQQSNMSAPQQRAVRKNGCQSRPHIRAASAQQPFLLSPAAKQKALRFWSSASTGERSIGGVRNHWLKLFSFPSHGEKPILHFGSSAFCFLQSLHHAALLLWMRKRRGKEIIYWIINFVIVASLIWVMRTIMES